MKMTTVLVRVADAYCAAIGRSRGRVSTVIFNDGKKLDQIAKGADLTTRSFERAMQWLSDHWPVGTDWPAEIERPAQVGRYKGSASCLSGSPESNANPAPALAPSGAGR
jgi:hypothetical protein